MLKKSTDIIRGCHSTCSQGLQICCLSCEDLTECSEACDCVNCDEFDRYTEESIGKTPVFKSEIHICEIGCDGNNCSECHDEEDELFKIPLNTLDWMIDIVNQHINDKRVIKMIHDNDILDSIRLDVVCEHGDYLNENKVIELTLDEAAETIRRLVAENNKFRNIIHKFQSDIDVIRHEIRSMKTN